MMVLLPIIVVLASTVIAIRIINTQRFASVSHEKMPAYYSEPANLSLYPTKIENITVDKVDQGAAQGFHFIPNIKEKRGVVIVFGGSEGTPGFEQAAMLSKNGYETLALFMFGQKNQPKTLTKIPLEQFEDVLSYLKNKEIDSKTMTIIAASKGAEYALNMATIYPDISNLILISPSAYTFNGLDFNDYGSSWTYKDEELPFIDIKKTSFTSFIRDMIIPLLTKSPISCRDMYTGAIERESHLISKTISVTNTKANILLLVGEDDQMWDSYTMAVSIEKQRPENTMVRSFPDAGHTLRGARYIHTGSTILEVGGEEKPNRKAKAESETLILETLMSWHTPLLED
ncbi:MAG: acyl-CoA thioester hydrolase/BAAT C-terminal domain-containing protein [Peptoniphilus sp.]|nr:acyl-CoA thioester hydrolase/BAAT C-terminal domain-containing protein [Peptoniphilus sp.]MDY3118797.1 acyl-CoA thioester hydrolase/BAAT C-terminal domain-containing protein [Peptoniphilus sp.]